MYRWVVNLDTSTVDISPIREFKEGKINIIIGIAYRISLLIDNKLPETKPIKDEMTTIIIDSLIILTKYFIYGTPKIINVK